MTEAELEAAEQFVANRIYQLNATQEPITDDEVVRVVKRTAERLKVDREKVRSATRKEMENKRLATKKKVARDAKRVSPPKSGGVSPQPKAQPKRTSSFAPNDPLDDLIDVYLNA